MYLFISFLTSTRIISNPIIRMMLSNKISYTIVEKVKKIFIFLIPSDIRQLHKLFSNPLGSDISQIHPNDNQIQQFGFHDDLMYEFLGRIHTI